MRTERERKMREDTIAVRATFLEKENAALRTAVSALREVCNKQINVSELSKNMSDEELKAQQEKLEKQYRSS